VIATLTQLDGFQMESRIIYEVLPTSEESTHKAKGRRHHSALIGLTMMKRQGRSTK
jgi:hypothetical protein